MWHAADVVGSPALRLPHAHNCPRMSFTHIPIYKKNVNFFPGATVIIPWFGAKSAPEAGKTLTVIASFPKIYMNRSLWGHNAEQDLGQWEEVGGELEVAIGGGSSSPKSTSICLTVLLKLVLKCMS